MKKLIILIIAGFWIGEAFPQSTWRGTEEHNTFIISWDKPVFKTIDRNYIVAISSVLFLTTRFKTVNKVRVIIDLPIAYYGEKGIAGTKDINSAGIGNMYLGGELDLIDNQLHYHSYLTFGVRIPTSVVNKYNDGLITGILSEIDRKEAFVPHSFTMSAISNVRILDLNGPFNFTLHLGGVFNTLTDKEYWGRNHRDLHLLYGGTALFHTSNFFTLLKFSGRRFLSGDRARFWDHGSWSQLLWGISYSLAEWTPGLYVRLPLGKNYSNIINWAYGITMKIHI